MSTVKSTHYSFIAGLCMLRDRLFKTLWVLVPFQMLACLLIALRVAENSLHFMIRGNVPFSWAVLFRDTMMDSPWSSFASYWLRYFPPSFWGWTALTALPVLLWPRKTLSYLPLTVLCLLQLALMRQIIGEFYTMSVYADYAHQLPFLFRFLFM